MVDVAVARNGWTSVLLRPSHRNGRLDCLELASALEGTLCLSSLPLETGSADSGRTGGFFCFVANRDIKAETAGLSGLSRTTASVTGRNKSTTSNTSMLLPAFSSSEKESATDDSSEKKICTWLGSVSYTHLTLPTMLMV